MHEEEIEGGGSLAGVARGMGGKGRACAVEVIRAPCSDPFRGGVEIARDDKRVAVLFKVSRHRVEKVVVGGFPDRVVVLGSIKADDLDQTAGGNEEREASGTSRVNGGGQGSHLQMASPDQADSRGGMLAIAAKCRGEKTFPA